MQSTPDIDPIGGGSEERQNAARACLDQNPRAMAVWRAHQWMWSAATAEQLPKASAAKRSPHPGSGVYRDEAKSGAHTPEGVGRVQVEDAFAIRAT
jgi:hypothetical protein